MMMGMNTTWMSLGLLVLMNLAHGDDIVLLDGHVLEGEIISLPGADPVDIRIRAGSMDAIRHIYREKIKEIKIGSSPVQQRASAFQARRDQLGAGGTAEEWWALAQEAKRDGDLLQWRSCANEVLRRDRHHQAAHRVFGHVQCRGLWMGPSEVAVSSGQVPFRGQWVSWREREATLAEEARLRAEGQMELAERRQAAAAADRAASGYNLVPMTEPLYRVTYWPNSLINHPYGGYQSGSSSSCPPTVRVNASGGGDHHRWNISWRF